MTCSQQALERHAVHPYFGQRAELPFTHYQALHALAHDRTREYLRKAYLHIQDVAAQRVPEGDAECFLARNPLSAAIVTAARREGIV